MNLLQPKDLLNYCYAHTIDCILHLSAVCAGIFGNAQRPADFLYANTQMALNVYEAARLANVKNVYGLGSVCQYPKFCPLPFEETNIWAGAAEETNFPYGQAKRTLMMLSQTYRQQYGIKGAFFIPVNMYGPYDHFNTTTAHVIPSLIMKFEHAKNNNILEVECWGTKDAGTSREFLYAQDCAEVIVNAVISDFDCDLPINIGTGKEIKIVELAELIANLTGYKGIITFNGQLDGQPRRCLHVSRAKELLNWEAKTSLREGLTKTIDWYRARELNFI